MTYLQTAGFYVLVELVFTACIWLGALRSSRRRDVLIALAALASLITLVEGILLISTALDATIRDTKDVEQPPLSM